MTLKTKKVIVTGGRDYKESDIVWDVLSTLNPDVVIHGDCKTGADRHAKEWALFMGVKQIPYPYKDELGRAGGPVRNEEMIDDNLDADYLVSFPGGRGTAHCTNYGRKVGLRILEIDEWKTLFHR